HADRVSPESITGTTFLAPSTFANSSSRSAPGAFGMSFSAPLNPESLAVARNTAPNPPAPMRSPRVHAPRLRATVTPGAGSCNSCDMFQSFSAVHAPSDQRSLSHRLPPGVLHSYTEGILKFLAHLLLDLSDVPEQVNQLLAQ